MRRLLTVIGILFYCQLLCGQTLPKLRTIPSHHFAHFERNKLLFPGQHDAMERFYQKLDSVVDLGEGVVNIMHIGGSHVQAGVFT